jgi:HTH-type transcriptional regulator/antitoxin HipB
MDHTYPIHFADQLRQQLRALRKHRGMTQARLGQILGVSQARVAEIEANPGLVNLDQMLKVFSALDLTLSLTENLPVLAPTVEEQPFAGNPTGPTKPATKPKAALAAGQRYNEYSVGPRYSVNNPRADYNAKQIRRVADNTQSNAPASPDASRADPSLKSALNKTVNPEAGQSREPGIKSDAQPTPPRGFNFQTKKGSW